MPLMSGKNDKAVSHNISMMMKEGKSHDQAIAIAMNKAGKKKKKSSGKSYDKDHIKLARKMMNK